MTPTRDEIMSEPAGPRMDAWVAEHVFSGNPPRDFECPRCGGGCFGAFGENYEQIGCHGYATQHSEDGGCGWKGTWADVAHMPFSHEIAAAWQVVEKILSQHTQDIYFGWCIVPPVWRFGFSKKETHCFNDHGAAADSAPLAICRAALLAIMDTVE